MALALTSARGILIRPGGFNWECKHCGKKKDKHHGSEKFCLGREDICCNCFFDSEDRGGGYGRDKDDEFACSKCKIRRQSWGGFTTLQKYQASGKEKVMLHMGWLC